MNSRITFLFFAMFWVAMNILLWRAEYGAHANEGSVPLTLVWHKILTAPDASSLSIYQNGERAGFCEFSTSVEMEMAKLDEDKVPPDGIVGHAGYQIRLNGNISLDDFTNRLRFDGRLTFSPNRQWRELTLKLSTRQITVFIHSAATNQTVDLEITADGSTAQRTITFAELQNPNAVLHAFAGNFTEGLLGILDLPTMPVDSSLLTEKIQWEAHRDRLMIGREPVSVYRVETHVLDHPIVIYASPLGEILRIDLPGGISAMLDEWIKA